MNDFREGGAGAFIREGAMLTTDDIEWYAALERRPFMGRANRGSKCKPTPQVKPEKPTPLGHKPTKTK